MKKFFAFAIATVALTVGCQKIQELVKPGTEPVDDTNPVEIQFTTNVVNVETKANGAVTEFGDAHTLYIYGLNADTEGVKEITNEPAKSTAKAADGVATSVTWADPTKTFFYNGTVDKYDFYGYYIDDAVKTAEPTKDNAYTFDVTITGQQDLLLAKADKAADFAAGTYTGITADDAYSAKTARAGLKPNLKFEHQLSQFTFSVRNHGNTELTLKAVSLEAVCEGTMVVAGNQSLTAKTTKKYLDLPMTDLNLVKKDDIPAGEDGFKNLDGSIMAFPAKTYTAKFYMTQTGMGEGAVRAVTVPVTITNSADVLTALGVDAANDPGALKGYAYNLQVTVYSLADIQITASLAKWTPGAVQILDTEDKEVGATEAEVVKLTLASTYSVPAEGITFTVDAGSVDYEVSIPTEAASWITRTDGTYEFTVAPNNAAGASARSAAITFTAGSESVTLTVNQEA